MHLLSILATCVNTKWWVGYVTSIVPGILDSLLELFWRFLDNFVLFFNHQEVIKKTSRSHQEAAETPSRRPKTSSRSDKTCPIVVQEVTKNHEEVSRLQVRHTSCSNSWKWDRGLTCSTMCSKNMIKIGRKKIINSSIGITLRKRLLDEYQLISKLKSLYNIRFLHTFFSSSNVSWNEYPWPIMKRNSVFSILISYAKPSLVCPVPAHSTIDHLLYFAEQNSLRKNKHSLSLFVLYQTSVTMIDVFFFFNDEC